MDRLQRRKASFDEQFEFPLIAESRNNTAHSRGIKPGQQRPTRSNECPLEFHFFFERSGPRRYIGSIPFSNPCLVGGTQFVGEYGAAGFGS